MQITHDQYIFPPRSKDAIPRENTEIFEELGWYAQLKYNDTHVLIKYCPDGSIELWNRHAAKLRSYTAPDHLKEELQELGQKLGITSGTTTILDGGIIDQKHVAIKDTIAIWDMLVHNNTHLVGTTYNTRYNTILNIADTTNNWELTHKTHEPIPLGPRLTENIIIPLSFKTGWESLWDTISTINAPYTTGTPNSHNYSCKPIIEGLVFKNPSGILGFGFKADNNNNWMVRSRVTTGRHNF